MVLGVFMAVDAPAGTHSYEMRFFPVGMTTRICPVDDGGLHPR